MTLHVSQTSPLHSCINFCPDLKNCIFARVVVHLDATTRASRSTHGNARQAILWSLSRCCFNDLLDLLPDTERASGEECWAFARTFLASRNPHAQETQALGFQHLSAL